MERPADFVDLIEVVWSGRRKIAIGIVLMCSIVGVAGLVMAPRYKATELLEVRVQHQKLGGLSSLARNLGGLAGLAGASIGGSGNGRSVALATLKSRYVIEHFIEKFDLLPVLFSSKWDKRANRWAVSNPEEIPNNQGGYKYFLKKILSVDDDGTTGLVRVVVQWRDPTQAAAWLNDIVAETNGRLQGREIARYRADISYLTRTAKDVVAVSVKQSLYSLMAIEYRKLMVAENPEDAPLEVVDPVVVPRRPESRIVLLIAFGVGGGGVLGLLYVILEAAIKARRKGIVDRRGAEGSAVQRPAHEAQHQSE